jgi:hypothetical protein
MRWQYGFAGTGLEMIDQKAARPHHLTGWKIAGRTIRFGRSGFVSWGDGAALLPHPGEFRMRAILAAILIALFTTTAFAQEKKTRPYGEEEPDKTAAQIAAEKAERQAYKRSLSNIPDQGPTDPWGGVRTNAAPNTNTAAAKTKKTKTGAADGKP